MNLDKLAALADRGRRTIRQPQNAGDWYRIANADEERAEVYLYDIISPWGVSADAFVRDLRAITAPAIDLHINSPGGGVFDSVAIYSALKNHAATVDTYVDGVAASAASFIAMAGDTVAIEKPAKMMIHDASGLVWGNAADMKQMADLLDELSDTIAEIYADRAGGEVADWRAAMLAETWYSSAQAVAAGLADRVANDSKASKADDSKAGNNSAPEDRRTQQLRARARVTLRG